MLLTDLTELKTVLEIDLDDTREDKKLLFFVEYASNWIEEILNRPDLTYKSTTEYYDGTNTKMLCLRRRPVFATPTVYVDMSGYYGTGTGSFNSTTSVLSYGRDFTLKLDWQQKVGPLVVDVSRSGILIRINNVWPKPNTRTPGYLSPWVGPDTGSIKITYTAGYTVDTLPPVFRMATNLLVAKMRYVFPLGLEMNSESYEDRFVSFLMEKKDYFLSLVKPLILPYRNWKF